MSINQKLKLFVYENLDFFNVQNVGCNFFRLKPDTYYFYGHIIYFYYFSGNLPRKCSCQFFTLETSAKTTTTSSGIKINPYIKLYTQYRIIRNGDQRWALEFLKNYQFLDAGRFLILQVWAWTLKNENKMKNLKFEITYKWKILFIS